MTDQVPAETIYKCACGWEGTEDHMSHFMVRKDLDTGSRFCPRCQSQLISNWKPLREKMS